MDPYLARGYQGPEVKTCVDPDGFVSTGDVGYINPDGFLFIKGRVDRMITVSDVNVFPEAIERAVNGIDAVEACAVVNRPDRSRGNQTICFVVCSSRDFTALELRKHCRDLLGDHHVPSVIRRVDSLPTLPSGKPDLQVLQNQAELLS